MQISEAWLRESVNPPIDTEQLVAQLTMAGLEVDSVQPAAAVFSGVVVGEVLALEQHPDADRLRICQVAVGPSEPLQIVCGASNVRIGLKIPAALVGAKLPGDFNIKKSKLRGVESLGMLCSEKELGLATEANGLMELPADAPIGVDIRDYLLLNDSLIEVDLTPNRADCLSVEGIAREVAVLNQLPWPAKVTEHAPVSHNGTLMVNVTDPAACPRYLGRLIKNVNIHAETPPWMKERLRRSGIRSLGPIVDVTNYVLIELGQPLHAFDADQLKGGITVRYGHTDEPLDLLNGQTITLDSGTLVIADDQQALALAGVMGGGASAVSDNTSNIFLECAFFTPRNIAGKARRYGLHTDSSHRFERGVDATLQERAIERATQLILTIAGGGAGPITECTDAGHLPKRTAIQLRSQRISKILGVTLADLTISKILQRLGMMVEAQPDGWRVTPPGFRFDISIEADLIEEIARIYGYNNLPNNRLRLQAPLGLATETVVDLERAKDLMVDRGYQEAITYSFVDEDIQKAIAPQDDVVRLKNPISSELSVMRSTLWCGLLKAALYNTNRQQTRVRLFETGLRFVKENGQLQQQKMLAGLALGIVYSGQWAEAPRQIDFFDIKADIEALLKLTGRTATFASARHPALHPGQSAQILTPEGQNIGWLGMMHPSLEQQLGFDSRVYLFELDQNLLLDKKIPAFKSLSKYPAVNRDWALIVAETVSADDIVNCIKSSGEATLKNITLFDVYRGKGVGEGNKSIALSLNLQDDTQTLTDYDVDVILNRILEKLTTTINAKLRD